MPENQFRWREYFPSVIYKNPLSEEKRALAKEFRKTPTPKENEVWQWIRNRRMFQLKWRRQQPINGYIADFYCAEAHAVLELDGEVHNNAHAQEYDAQRDHSFVSRGIRVFRMKNEDASYENVKALMKYIREFTSPLSSMERGNGDTAISSINRGNDDTFSPSPHWRGGDVAVGDRGGEV